MIPEHRAIDRVSWNPEDEIDDRPTWPDLTSEEAAITERVPEGVTLMH